MATDLFHFVESPGFTKRIDKLASLDVLLSLQSDLVRNPLLGDLMEGCGGARKVESATKLQVRARAAGFDMFTFTLR